MSDLNDAERNVARAVFIRSVKVLVSDWHLVDHRIRRMKLFFSSVTFGLFSFFLWSALKPSKPQTGNLLKPPRATERSSESMDDPKLPPLRDPWDRKWQI
jgi:hypothetical protein